jgi:hypothetical protein
MGRSYDASVTGISPPDILPDAMTVTAGHRPG